MSADPSPRPVPTPAVGTAPLLPPLLGFGIDVLIATGLLLSLSVAGFA
ncbi:CPBP family intramembrane metalloprotease, partial [Xanthomonas citri pv. citri]|nr:CPBP family intramembrane metalloprotease [Xanthomonas citri pv. citri]